MTQRSSPDPENRYAQVSESGAPRDARKRLVWLGELTGLGRDRERKARRSVNRSAVCHTARPRNSLNRRIQICAENSGSTITHQQGHSSKC
jgi:hypothetical protein